MHREYSRMLQRQFGPKLTGSGSSAEKHGFGLVGRTVSRWESLASGLGPFQN